MVRLHDHHLTTEHSYMYIIVVGAGSIGSQVIELAVTAGHEVVVVETDPAVADTAAADYDCLVLNDDATEKETLQEAGAEKADAVISTTDREAVNIMVMLLADDLGIPSLVSVVHNPEHMQMFRRIGVNVLENPQRLIAEYLFQAVQRPSVKDFMRLADGAEIVEITASEGAPIVDKTLRAADDSGLLGDEVLVVAIERGETVITPKGDTTIEAGDLVTVFSRDGITEELMQIFRGDD